MRLISQLPLAAVLLLLAAGPSQPQEYEVSVIGEVQVRYRNVSITGHELNVSSSSAQHRAFRFLGLPYAQPPTRGLRFAPPTPLDPDASDSVNATLTPPTCPHPGVPLSAASEDCLYLSVRTPDLTGRLPVLILLSSSAVNATHGDVFVATQGTVVMVTVASRQGVLGYLIVGRTDNVGLQDERMALMLIRDAVGSFGGDPTRVTLGGHGAAAAAVGLHAVIDGSADLFQQVVMLGGSIASPLAWSESRERSDQLSVEFIEKVGCKVSSDSLGCLRNVSVDELLKAEQELQANFVPVAGGELLSGILRPDSHWKNGSFAGALLIGAAAEAGRTLADEAAGGRWDSVTSSSLEKIVNQQFRYFPRFPALSTDDGRSFLRLIHNDFPDRKYGLNVRPLVTQAIGDYRFICPVWEAASDLVEKGKGPVFMFLHETLDSVDTDGHSADVLYFLGVPLVEARYAQKHQSLSQTMMQHLAAFVINNASDIWPRLSLLKTEFMHYKVQENVSIAETKLGGFGLEPGRCLLWKHELPFLSNISASFDAVKESQGSLVDTVHICDVGNQKSAGADTILSNYSISIIGFGFVIGQTIRTDAGVTISEFLGIPYAKPPLGNLRFAKPETTSATVHIALAMPPLCIQRTNLSMSEDCLYLNLCTPLHTGQTVSNLPVIVYLHGGFFQLGGISEDRWRCSRMLNHANAVLITVSYRLGVFGFLSLDSANIPGNFGLWDQAQALEWVFRYVDRFGGSRTKVALMGVEAGAVAVGYHMARPGPLRFQRAVMLTGSPHMTYPLSDDTAAVRTRNQIFVHGVLGCAVDTLNCLRNLNATYINEMQTEFQKLYPGIEFPPVIDGDFIKSDPLKMDVSKLAKVPLVFGGVDSPGNLLVARLRLGDNFTHDKFLQELADSALYFPRYPYPLPSEGKEALQRHFTDYNRQDNAIRNARTLSSAIGSLHFTCANNRFLDAVAADRQVYSFRFTEPSQGGGALPGANLFDDAFYAFGNPATPAKPLGADQAQLSVAMIRSLVAFTNDGIPSWTSPWPVFKKDDRKTLVMRADSHAASPLTSDVFMGQDCGFWDHVLPCVIDRNCLSATTTPGTLTTIETGTDTPTTTGTGTDAPTTTGTRSDTPTTIGTGSDTTTTTGTRTDTPTTTGTRTDTSTTTGTRTDTPTTTGTRTDTPTTTGNGTDASTTTGTGTDAPTTPGTGAPPQTRTAATMTTSTDDTPRASTTTPSQPPPMTTTTSNQGAGPPPGFIAIAVVVPIVALAFIGVSIFIILKVVASKGAVAPGL